MNLAGYYAAPDHLPALQQGDFVLAPIVRVESPAGRPSRWSTLDQADLPVTVGGAGLDWYRVKSGYSVVMVTTHDCQLDKEFLQFYKELRRLQIPKAQAVEEAELNEDLDRFINVSPLLPLDSFRAKRDALFRNEVIGCFPVPPKVEYGIGETVVDLTFKSTIERHLVVERLAVLSEEARTDLRYALARLDALRTPAIGFELENAVGKRIQSVRPASRAGGIVLELATGEELELLHRPAEVARGGAERVIAPRETKPR